MDHEPEMLLEQLRALREEMCNIYFALAKREIFGFCRGSVQSPEEAEEIALDALTASLDKILRFETVAAFKAYTFGCAKNIIGTNWKRRAAAKRDVRKTTSLDADPSEGESLLDRLPDGGVSPMQSLEAKERVAVVRAALLDLDEPCGSLIRSHKISEQTLEVCAAERGIAVSTVHDQFNKCMGQLRKLLYARLKHPPR